MLNNYPMCKNQPPPWLTQGYLGEPERSEELWRGRLAAYRRRRRHRCRRLSEGRGPYQGCRQDRRRMGVVARHRGHHPASPWRRRGGRRRRPRRPLGRAAGGVRRRQEGGRRRAKMRFAATLPTSPVVARSRSTQCPTRSTSWTRFRRPASGKLDKKVIRAKLLETAADAATTR